MIWSEADSQKLANTIGGSDNPIEAAAAVIGSMCSVLVFYQGFDFTKKALQSIHDQVGISIGIPPGQPIDKSRANGAATEGDDDA